jgi:hypothetical protein
MEKYLVTEGSILPGKRAEIRYKSANIEVKPRRKNQPSEKGRELLVIFIICVLPPLHVAYLSSL